MNLTFAAGDVGGARALLAVARAAAAAGHKVTALDHGVLADEGDAAWTWVALGDAAALDADVVLYATSVADPLAFRLAHAARARGVPVLHVLDNWASYGARLSGTLTDGCPAHLVPDIYAVMDRLAYDEAVREGVPAAVLHVTGHPDLAKLSREAATLTPARPAHLLFVSEPAAADSGPTGSSASRGYDEVGVSRAVAAVLRAQRGIPEVLVAPHPREDRAAVARRWDGLLGANGWTMVAQGRVRVALHGAGWVAGMSSLLLYEAWLLGIPVASLQPGLRGEGLRTLAARPGLIFAPEPAGTAAAMRALLARNRDMAAPPQPELQRHETAAEAILALAARLRQRDAVQPE